MQWVQFFLLIILIMVLFVWNRFKFNSDHRKLKYDMDKRLQIMREGMRDFHRRFERQDAEFKSYLRNKEK